jgi:hypothetical protein
MNEIILSLGGIAKLNGSCPLDATDEQLAAFLNSITYAEGRAKLTVAEVREQQSKMIAEQSTRDRQDQNIQARQYLDSTDWYILRQLEIDKPVPADVLVARQQARESIK